MRILTRRKFLKITPEGVRKEKEIDVTLSTDLVAYAFKDCYDIAAIIAGDRDYRPAIHFYFYLKEKLES